MQLPFNPQSETQYFSLESLGPEPFTRRRRLDIESLSQQDGSPESHLQCVARGSYLPQTPIHLAASASWLSWSSSRAPYNLCLPAECLSYAATLASKARQRSGKPPRPFSPSWALALRLLPSALPSIFRWLPGACALRDVAALSETAEPSCSASAIMHGPVLPREGSGMPRSLRFASQG